MNENKLGTEKISKLYMTIVIPSMFAMLIIGIQSLIGGLFLGTFVGANAMASVNIAIPFFQLLQAVGMVLSIGGMAYIGRLLGAGKDEEAKTVFKTGVIALLASAVAFSVVTQLLAEPIMKIMGANEVLIHDAVIYIRFISCYLPFMFMYYFTSMVNRVIGKAHLFTISTVVSIIVNVSLNYITIVQLEMGIYGTVISSGVTNFLSFLINVRPYLKRDTVLNIYEGKFNRVVLGKISYNGSSEGVTSLSTAVTMWLFNLTFMHYYGESGVTAFSIINYISNVAILLIFGIADGISPVVSYNYGAGLKERVKKIVATAAVIVLSFGVLTYATIYLKGEQLIAFFGKGDMELVSLTYNGAKIYATMFFLCGVNILASAYFTAIGDALKSILVSGSRGLVFILIGIATLPRIFGVTGVWAVVPFADMITFMIVILLVLSLRRGGKLKR